MISSLLIGAISLATVFLFGCVGETIMEKAGHLNLGIPGIMCMGTAGGCLGAALFTNLCGGEPSYILLVLISVVTAVVFAAAGGAIYGFLTVTLKCNQNITGLAVTTFGVGLTQFLMDNIIQKRAELKAALFSAGSVMSTNLPFFKDLGWFGEVFLSYGIL
ncbi:MAG: ABC transporter permease, partial [Clostridia bacterium]|nr:ABC transporter permease [Clostridia bacterium]